MNNQELEQQLLSLDLAQRIRILQLLAQSLTVPEVLDFRQFLTQRTPPKIEEMTPHEKAEDWLKFLESQPKDTPGLPDEALSRETIYD